MIKMSEAQKGKLVSTINKYNGIGLGHLVGEVVYVSTGNGWAIEATQDVFGMVEYKNDGGQLYRQTVNSLVGW